MCHLVAVDQNEHSNTCRLGLDQMTRAVFALQNGREDSLLANTLMTPPRSSTILDNSLHKDVFGVISGTGRFKNNNSCMVYDAWKDK